MTFGISYERLAEGHPPGREDLALSATAILPRDVPDKFWRRIGCISYDDVGVASLEAVELATVAWLANGTTPRAPANG